MLTPDPPCVEVSSAVVCPKMGRLVLGSNTRPTGACTPPVVVTQIRVMCAQPTSTDHHPHYHLPAGMESTLWAGLPSTGDCATAGPAAYPTKLVCRPTANRLSAAGWG